MLNLKLNRYKDIKSNRLRWFRILLSNARNCANDILNFQRNENEVKRNIDDTKQNKYIDRIKYDLRKSKIIWIFIIESTNNCSIFKMLSDLKKSLLLEFYQTFYFVIFDWFGITCFLFYLIGFYNNCCCGTLLSSVFVKKC